MRGSSGINPLLKSITISRTDLYTLSSLGTRTSPHDYFSSSHGESFVLGAKNVWEQETGTVDEQIASLWQYM